MEREKVYRSIGLMSGTSLDGSIDVALIETDGQGVVRPLGFYAHPCDAAVRDTVRACFGKTKPDTYTQEAERQVTDIHIAAVKASGFHAEIIGFHGQTITHDPSQGFTWQLGDGARMAKETGMDVVHDFRSADMKAGGQGAPLAPLYHQAIFEGHARPVAVLNLGGVGNVSYIGKDRLIAFDTGPANALMDDFCAKHFGKDFDLNGAIARGGKADKAVVDAFLAHDYFKKIPPKSLDRNDFEGVLKSLPKDPKDAMASLAVCSAASVAASLKHFPRGPQEWYVCGGGRKNAYMVELLADMLAPAPVKAIEEAGFDGDAIEAQAFAYLAVRSKLGLPLSLPSTTGVAEPLCGGVYHKA